MHRCGLSWCGSGVFDSDFGRCRVVRRAGRPCLSAAIAAAADRRGITSARPRGLCMMQVGRERCNHLPACRAASRAPWTGCGRSTACAGAVACAVPWAVSACLGAGPSLVDVDVVSLEPSSGRSDSGRWARGTPAPVCQICFQPEAARLPVPALGQLWTARLVLPCSRRKHLHACFGPLLRELGANTVLFPLRPSESCHGAQIPSHTHKQYRSGFEHASKQHIRLGCSR